jgi:hypothetical protein
LPTLAFFPSRNIGVMAHNTAFEQRMTWALGAFRDTASFSNLGDAQDSFDDAIGYDLTARITGVPLYADAGRRSCISGCPYRTWTCTNRAANPMRK